MKVRAKGDGYFVRAATRAYRPSGSLFGQIYDDSCVAACCRMLLEDEGQTSGEAMIRAALAANYEGAYLSVAATVLSELSGVSSYVYQENLKLADLRSAAGRGPVLVFLKEHPRTGFGHAVIVDGFSGEQVCIRDPWPPAIGATYRVKQNDFEKAWLVWSANDDFTGRAVVLK